MLPFLVEFKQGSSVEEQVVHAVKRAVVTGQLLPGDKFPSVHAISQELRIHPEVAARAVDLLLAARLLEKSGDLVVSEKFKISRETRLDLLAPEMGRVLAEARCLTLDLSDVVHVAQQLWKPKNKTLP